MSASGAFASTDVGDYLAVWQARKAQEFSDFAALFYRLFRADKSVGEEGASGQAGGGQRGLRAVDHGR